MEETKRNLNLEELAAANGGNLDEYRAYLAKMAQKYGCSVNDVSSYMTNEEIAIGYKWMMHVPGTPDPEA